MPVPRRKKILTKRLLGEPVPRFSDSEWAQLESAYGQRLSRTARHDLSRALDAWSLFAGSMREFEYGRAEAARIQRMSRSADSLLGFLRSPSELEDLLLRDAMSETNCDLDRFLAMLSEISLMSGRAAKISGEECGPEELQISMIADALRNSGCPVTVAKKIKDVNFTPSPFVRLIDTIWKLRPRTRLHSPSGDRDASLSQWISERLRAERS